MQRGLQHLRNLTPQFDVPQTPSSSNGSICSSTLTLPTSARDIGTRQKDEIINSYLEDTRLIAVVEALIKDFANNEELPYNPFTELARQARSHAERFNMFARESSAAVDKSENELGQDGSYSSQTHDSPACCGLPSLLRRVNTECLAEFDWLLSSMNTDVTTHNSEDYSYIIQKPVLILLGPCVFTGTVYPEAAVENVGIRMEYAISGPHESEAAEMFANAVLADIQSMLEPELHILLGITVPRKEDGNQEFWTCNGMEQRQDQFLASIKAAAVFHKMPVVKCMFLLQPDTRQYRRGFKQYNLNFIRTSEEGSVSTSTHPYLSAHEGVFASHYDVKEYLSWFVNVNAALPPLANLPTTTKNQGVTGKSKKNRASLQSSSQSQAGKNTSSSGNNLLGGPFSEEVINTVKGYFSERISELDRQNEFFKMLHFTVLRLLLSRESSEFSESFLEACALFKSTAYQLYVVIQQNISLQDLVEFFSSCGKGASDVVQNHFWAYRQSMKDVFDNTLKERSRDLLVWGKVLLKLLDSMTVINPHMEGKAKTGTLPLTSEVVGGLRVLNRYSETILLRLLDDALSNCSHIVKYFPSVKNSGGFVVQQSYKHGAERGDIINQYKMVLNVADQVKRVAAPSSIARETVVLQYFMDSRIDQVFHEFLVDVVTDARFIPPNPYRRLVSQLTLAATRMELFGERRSRLLSKLISASVQRLDSENFLCHLPGVEAYGVVSAIAALDGKFYSSLRAKIHCLSNRVNPRITISGFKTLVDVAISGFGSLYGRLMPYLHQLELEEHYFVQGPKNAKTEAIHNFTKVVYEHLEEFSEKQDVLFIGFFLGGESFRRSLQDILSTQRKKTFLTQMLAAVKSKQRLYMKVYLKLDWRYVVVKKSFLLHFIDNQTLNYERYYNVSGDPVAFYQNVFSKQDVALLYARCCGPQDHTDPCKGENLALSVVHVDHYIVRAKEEENLLAVYRWLMLKSLMNQHKSYVTEAWCMFHSCASQMEYLCTLNRTLQSLVNEELSRTFRPLLEEDERTSLLDASSLSTMVTAYGDKLERVLSRGTVMAPKGLLPRLRGKLRLVTAKDPVSRSLMLIISPKTPVILQEINEILQPLIDAAAHNVHVICPEIHSAIKSVEVDLSGRKNSRDASMQK